MSLCIVSEQSDTFHRILTFLHVTSVGRVSVAAKMLRNSCKKDGKLVVGIVTSTRKCIAWQLPHLHVASLAGIGVKGSDAELGVPVLAMVTPNINLQYLSIVSGTLLPWATQGLCSAIAQAARLRVLNISSCNVGNESGKRLADLLKTDTKLVEFTASACQLGDAILDFFAAIEHNAALKVLDVSSNGCGHTACDSIQKMLLQNKTLVRLSLAGNSIRLQSYPGIEGELVAYKSVFGKLPMPIHNH